jgi:hypothetical protein
MEQNDPAEVLAPGHYGGADNPYEVIKVLRAWGVAVPFALGSAIKYIARHGKKPGEGAIKDLKKARWYIDWVIQELGTGACSRQIVLKDGSVWPFPSREVLQSLKAGKKIPAIKLYRQENEAPLAVSKEIIEECGRQGVGDLLD